MTVGFDLPVHLAQEIPTTTEVFAIRSFEAGRSPDEILYRLVELQHWRFFKTISVFSNETEYFIVSPHVEVSL